MSEIRVIAFSDNHGMLPPAIPECDILLIAGDIAPTPRSTAYMGMTEKCFIQAEWLRNTFKPWLEAQPVKHTVAVWGNHDWIGENRPDMVPTGIPWTVLTDAGTEIMGLKIWGTPWQPRFWDWAFNLDEPDLVPKWEMIPEGTDILVTHGPPNTFGDLTEDYASKTMQNVGSPSLLKRLLVVRPQLHVFGHIHSGAGRFGLYGSQLANVSLVNERYQMVREPQLFALTPRVK